jgi:hypothetical protein
MESWRRVMPDYEIMEWNESNSPMGSAYVRTARENRLWTKISNFVRLYAVYKEGGIYLDVDVEVVKRFDDLLENGCFFGFQQPEEHEDWVNNAVFGAVAGHPFLRRCMNETFARFLTSGTYYRSPQVTTLLLRQSGLAEHGLVRIDDIQLYPSEYFYPYPWWEKFDARRITDNTRCIHHWELSWFDEAGNPREVAAPTAPVDARRQRPAATSDRIGSMDIQVVDVRCFDDSGLKTDDFRPGQAFRVDLVYELGSDVGSARFSVGLESRDGAVCFESNSEAQDVAGGEGASGIASLRVRHLPLEYEDYYLTVGAYEKDWAYAFDWQRRVRTLKVGGETTKDSPERAVCVWNVSPEP